MPDLKMVSEKDKKQNINEKILDAISDLIWQDVSEMQAKAKDKAQQKKFYVAEMDRARKEYREVVIKRNYENIEDVSLAVDNLVVATSAFNGHCVLSVAECLKISKYTRSIIEIEKNRRGEIVYSGLTDLDDNELENEVEEILRKRREA